MPTDPLACYEAFVQDYARRDFANAITFFADDVVMAIHIDRELVPFGGVTIGKAQVLQRWAMVASQFDMPLYRLEHAVRDGDQIRGRIAYRFAHYAGGEVIEGHMRHVATMRGETCARGQEFHDRARVEAFFRLIASADRGV